MAELGYEEPLAAEGSELLLKDGTVLEGKLRQIDTKPPRRTKGRQSHHRERYAIVRYLNALARASYLSFPLRVVKAESPDFFLHLPSEMVGLEVTEVGIEKDQQAMTQLERSSSDTVLEGKGELRRLGQMARGRSYIGDQPERELAGLIVEAHEAKTKKLNEPHFKSADRYELLIYENSHIMANLKDLAPLVRESLKSWQREVTAAEKEFATTSLLSGSTLLYDCAGAGLLLPTTSKR